MTTRAPPGVRRRGRALQPARGERASAARREGRSRSMQGDGRAQRMRARLTSATPHPPHPPPRRTRRTRRTDPPHRIGRDSMTFGGIRPLSRRASPLSRSIGRLVRACEPGGRKTSLRFAGAAR
ncbi:hypothetical protein X946_5295 [Burkholderia sp. ABCPW 111]|nr:hypothetical protein X946_5295 [Burkholderia sp. ABCPW 111]